MHHLYAGITRCLVLALAPILRQLSSRHVGLVFKNLTVPGVGSSIPHERHTYRARFVVVARITINKYIMTYPRWLCGRARHF